MKKYLVLAAAVFVLFTAVKLHFISSTMVIDDEAYYGMYSRHLAPGYIDHGPVVALLVRASTAAFGETAFGVRAGSVALLSLLSIALFWFGARFHSPRAGWALFLISMTTLLYFAGSVVVTPDTPMVFFMMLALMLYYAAFFSHRYYFYPAGVMLGLAMLSKISVVFPALGVFLFPLIAPEKRAYLRCREFYLSFIIAAAVFSPFLVWNFQNDLAFIRYQGAHVFRPGGIKSFFDLWGAQAGLLFPILFFFAIYLPGQAIVNRIRARAVDPRRLFFAITAAVPLGYFMVQSLFSRYEANWPAPAFFGGIMLAGMHIAEHWERLRTLFAVQVAASCALIAVAVVQVVYSPIALPAGKDVTNRYYAYQALAGPVREFLERESRYRSLRMMSANYQIPSMVNLYLRPDREAVAISVAGYHDTLYSFVYRDATLVGQDYLFVWLGEEIPNNIRRHFNSIERVASFPSVRAGRVVGVVTLWEAKGYRGRAF